MTEVDLNWKRRLRSLAWFGLGISMMSLPAMAGDMRSAAEILQTKPTIDNVQFTSAVPINAWGGKISIPAEVNGKAYRFILDTGSPTILTKAVADELGLVIEAENTGKDAHGNLVQMGLAILEQLRIGEVIFRNIPVFIYDATQQAIARCMLDGGIIGSEIMPLANWQINFANKELVLADDVGNLDHVENAQKADLQVFTYPFTPILQHRINGEFTDNAVLDTGNTELLHLNQRAFEELRKRKLVSKGSVEGRGSWGESAGGRGKDRTVYWVTLEELAIGETRFRDISVATRPDVPSLIGARIFETHIVTLDYDNKIVYWHEYQKPKAAPGTYGVRFYVDNQSVYVAFLWDSSSAAVAGLQLHDQVLRINDIDLANLEPSTLCETQKWLMRTEQLESMQITFVHDGSEKHVSLQKRPLH